MAREWYGNGAPTPISGRLEFIQETELSPTHTLVELQGLEGEASTYHVHEIPVQPQLEFACSGDAVGGHFNPWQWDPANSTAAALRVAAASRCCSACNASLRSIRSRLCSKMSSCTASQP